MTVLLQIAPAAPASGPTGIGNFWRLVEQAGPLRWPILAVLAVGLVLVLGKLYELLRDRSLSRALAAADLRSTGLEDIRRQVGRQQESMLATLQSSMLNVFATRPTEGMLHDEIANFVSFQQDQFATFRRRMEFLSDTAGALGLMGTVWGMFTVFFAGTADKDVILRGMGIALITTLLGLVVSIVLNLSATELSTFFDKRLEQVAKQSDRLRFRLLELGPAGGVAVAPAPVPRADPVPPVPAPPPAPAREAAHTPPPPPPAAPAPAWYDLESDPAEYVARAGDTRRDLAVTLRRNGGEPAAGVPVAIAVPPGAGTLEEGQASIRRDSDRQGRVRFAWTAPARAGRFALDASIVGQAGAGRRIHLRVEPAAPHRTECEGNNQAAVAGMRLPRPLGVTVYDRFGNPVPGVPVTFAVKSGAGRLGQHAGQVGLTTDTEGSARTVFAVADVPGPNVVVAAVEGQPPVEFCAFGTEV